MYPVCHPLGGLSARLLCYYIYFSTEIKNTGKKRLCVVRCLGLRNACNNNLHANNNNNNNRRIRVSPQSHILLSKLNFVKRSLFSIPPSVLRVLSASMSIFIYPCSLQSWVFSISMPLQCTAFAMESLGFHFFLFGSFEIQQSLVLRSIRHR